LEIEINSSFKTPIFFRLLSGSEWRKTLHVYRTQRIGLSSAEKAHPFGVRLGHPEVGRESGGDWVGKGEMGVDFDLRIFS
jgi:hypothetical protein